MLKEAMTEAQPSKIAFYFTRPIPSEILTAERLVPITISLVGLDADDIRNMLDSGNVSVMASLMSADGRVPMALINQNIFGGQTFSLPVRGEDQVEFHFDDLVIRQSGNFRIQFALIKREEAEDQGGQAPVAPTVPLSRHTEVIHVSAFVQERNGNSKLILDRCHLLT